MSLLRWLWTLTANCLLLLNFFLRLLFGNLYRRLGGGSGRTTAGDWGAWTGTGTLSNMHTLLFLQYRNSHYPPGSIEHMLPPIMPFPSAQFPIPSEWSAGSTDSF
jgi:hypothetical protein